MEQQPYRTTADLRIKKAQVTLDSSFASVLSTTPTPPPTSSHSSPSFSWPLSYFSLCPTSAPPSSLSSPFLPPRPCPFPCPPPLLSLPPPCPPSLSSSPLLSSLLLSPPFLSPPPPSLPLSSLSLPPSHFLIISLSPSSAQLWHASLRM